MMFRVRCPHCDTKLKIPDEFAGRQVECTRCARMFTAISPNQESECPECGAAMSPGAVLCIECGLDLRTMKRADSAERKANRVRRQREIAPGSMTLWAKPQMAGKIFGIILLLVGGLSTLGIVLQLTDRNLTRDQRMANLVFGTIGTMIPLVLGCGLVGSFRQLRVADDTDGRTILTLTTYRFFIPSTQRVNLKKYRVVQCVTRVTKPYVPLDMMAIIALICICGCIPGLAITFYLSAARMSHQIILRAQAVKPLVLVSCSSIGGDSTGGNRGMEYRVLALGQELADWFGLELTEEHKA